MLILSVFDVNGDLIPVAASRHISVIEEIKQKLRARRVNIVHIDEYDVAPETLEVDFAYPKVPA